MLHIKKLEDGAELFKTLGSDIRIHILRLLLFCGLEREELLI